MTVCWRNACANEFNDGVLVFLDQQVMA